MGTLQRLWLRLAPSHETGAFGGSGDDAHGLERSRASQWFLDNSYFIAMLAMALAGVIFRLPVIYWLALIPIFALISIAEGWRHFATRGERMGLACRVAAIWGALLLCIYLLYSGGVEGVMNVNASSLAMMTLLALGTFVAGVQARVWQISGVGVLLFLAVPGIGWLDQSPLLVTAAACAIVALSGIIWWIRQTRPGADVEARPLENPPFVVPLDDGSRRSS